MSRGTPHLYAQALLQATRGVSRNQAEGAVGRFVMLLKRQGRLSWSKRIVAEFARLVAQEEVQSQVRVTTAHALSKRAQQEFTKAVTAITREEDDVDAEESRVIFTQDPSGIGGAVVQKGYTIIDASVRTMLARLTS